MKNSRPSRRLGFLWFLGFALVCLGFGAACISVGSAEPNIPAADALETQPTADRANCEEIAGTPFRSSAERDWFNENCSRWPLLKSPDPIPAVNNNVTPEQQRECDRLRGKPYENDAQRRFWLENCAGNRQNSNSAQSNDGQQQGGSDGNSQSGENRQNCDQIRGSSYRSPAERDWYLQNCSGNQGSNDSGNGQAGGDTQARQLSSQEVASTCASMRARGSVSQQELAWYNRYCR